MSQRSPELRSVPMGSISAPPPPFSSPSFALMGSQHKPVSAMLSKPTFTKWVVDQKLPSLTTKHQIGRTNVYVDESSQEVADRISNCMRMESVATKVSKDEKNTLLAESNQGLKFAIRLFSNDSCVVVVDLQRLTGCSFEFSQLSKAVYRSAKGLGRDCRKRKLSLPNCIARESEEQREKFSQEALFIAISNFLQSDAFDTQLMALESMEKLSTRPYLVNSIFAGECFAKLIQCCEDDLHLLSDMQRSYACLMKRRALGILANGLAVCSTFGKIEIPSELTSESFARNLLSHLSESADEPHLACQAARCLQVISSNRSMRSLLTKDLDVISFLPCCECHHLALEQESKKLKMTISAITA